MYALHQQLKAGSIERMPGGAMGMANDGQNRAQGSWPITIGDVGQV
jgi:hypothetical protein